MNVVFRMMGVPLWLLTLYIICYAGSMMTMHFEELADVVYQPKWYEYDPQIKKYMVLLIANCQQMLELDGLKLVYLSVVTFSRVSISTCGSHILL